MFCQKLWKIAQNPSGKNQISILRRKINEKKIKKKGKKSRVKRGKQRVGKIVITFSSSRCHYCCWQESRHFVFYEIVFQSTCCRIYKGFVFWANGFFTGWHRAFTTIFFLDSHSLQYVSILLLLDLVVFDTRRCFTTIFPWSLSKANP